MVQMCTLEQPGLPIVGGVAILAGIAGVGEHLEHQAAAALHFALDLEGALAFGFQLQDGRAPAGGQGHVDVGPAEHPAQLERALLADRHADRVVPAGARPS